LFPTRWCKDPDPERLRQHYFSFYTLPTVTNPTAESSQAYQPTQHGDYQFFLLNRTMRRMERFAKRHPDTTSIIDSELTKVLANLAEKSGCTDDPNTTIKNPLTVSNKGAKKKDKQKAVELVTTKRKITCGTCGRPGHTSRSKLCPGKRIEERSSDETVDGEPYDPADLPGIRQLF
jgi:hypothetical protein